MLSYPRIKEESEKLKDIYEKYKSNKNSRNIQNKDNTQTVKEPISDSNPNNTLVNINSYSNLNKSLKGGSNFNEPLKNQNINIYSVKTENLTKR